jgi:hypothetical protein
MGIDLSSTDAAFGFRPYGPVLRARLYAINTAPTINVCKFDIVKAGGAIVSTPLGYKQIIEDGSVPDGGTALLGSVLGVYDSTNFPVNYIAPAAAGNGTIAGYVLVADHPDQLYIAQEDGDSNAIDLAEGSMNADIICATLCAPDSNTGLSTQEIDSTSAATTASLSLKLMEPHQDDTPATDATPNSRWICQINAHFYGDTIVGV